MHVVATLTPAKLLDVLFFFTPWLAASVADTARQLSPGV